MARELRDAGSLPDRSDWAAATQERRARLQRRTHFDDIPIKPQRVYEEMNKAFGPETRYVTTIGLSQIAGAQMLHVYRPRHWINCGQAGLSAGRSRPRWALPSPTRRRPWSLSPGTTTSSS